MEQIDPALALHSGLLADLPLYLGRHLEMVEQLLLGVTRLSLEFASTPEY